MEYILTISILIGELGVVYLFALCRAGQRVLEQPKQLSEDTIT